MADHIRETARAVALATVAGPLAVHCNDADEHWEVATIQPMDEPYPVDILPRLSTAGSADPPPGVAGFKGENGQMMAVLADGTKVMVTEPPRPRGRGYYADHRGDEEY